VYRVEKKIVFSDRLLGRCSECIMLCPTRRSRDRITPGRVLTVPDARRRTRMIILHVRRHVERVWKRPFCVVVLRTRDRSRWVFSDCFFFFFHRARNKNVKNGISDWRQSSAKRRVLRALAAQRVFRFESNVFEYEPKTWRGWSFFR